VPRPQDLGLTDFARNSNPAEDPYQVVCAIDFPPAQALAAGVHKFVVIVMPASSLLMGDERANDNEISSSGSAPHMAVMMAA